MLRRILKNLERHLVGRFKALMLEELAGAGDLKFSIKTPRPQSIWQRNFVI
jgi:hypothetical protein